MLFRPSFCSNCGEKIERSDWHFWTSSRFCDLCVTELPVQEYAPKIVVGIAMLASIVGFGSYLRSGSNGVDAPLTRQRRVENSNPTTQPIVSSHNPVVNGNVSETNTGTAPTAPRTLAAMPPPKPEATVKVAADEMYFCGAQTKKGTPCSRRVKGNVRCYQHQGMPAMMAGDKLRAG